jgi:hypothetical protein
LMLVVVVGTVLAKPTAATIDGNISDWSDATCYSDPGGADDESSPMRADITRFCIHVDSSYLYVLLTWDDTLPNGGGSSAGVRLDINDDMVYDYIILDTISRSGSTLVANQARVHTCTAGNCGNGGAVCDQGGSPTCSSLGVLEAVNNNSSDPFAHTSGCDGTNCTTQDAFVEMAIPWSVFGMAGPPSPQTFGNYGSFPSGPAQAPKDSTGSNGISCTPTGGCFISSPTAVTLLSNEAIAVRGPLAVSLVALLGLVTVLAVRKR